MAMLFSHKKHGPYPQCGSQRVMAMAKISLDEFEVNPNPAGLMNPASFIKLLERSDSITLGTSHSMN